MSDKPKEQSPRCTAAEMDSRTEIVLNHLLMGRSRSYIVRFAAKEWDIGSRAVDELMARARAEMREVNAGTREESIEQITSNF